MKIRHSTPADLPRMQEIYARARAFMVETGNPNQWGPTNWPPEPLLRKDIAEGNSYVCEKDGCIVGTFFFAVMDDPTYRTIVDGAWMDDSPYGVIHRIAADGTAKGVGEVCFNWAMERCGHMRVDTHGDNVVMQNLMKKLDFTHCGTIYVEEDNYPRLAYEKTNKL